MTEPLDLAAIEQRDTDWGPDMRALIAEVKRLRAQVAAVEALCDRAQMHDHDGFKTTYVSWVRAALNPTSEDTP
jgi:hypothetical protein